jgi:hypothetical protein
VVRTWKPPVFKEEEEKKKFTWTPPKPIIEEEEVVKATWQPPKPVVESIDLSKYTKEGYEEPTWTDVAFHSTRAGFGDLQSMMLSLGRLLYEGGVQVTDKVTDIFDKDIYDPKKDKLRAWIGDLVTKSETIAEDSWEKVISKNRLKNFVALGGRAVPLSLITLLSGGALVGAHPALAMKIGSLPTHMIPFGAASVGGHSRRIEREFEVRGQEAPYVAQLLGGVMGAMGEVATEAIPFQRWLNVFGGSRVVNRGAKTFLAKYGKMGIDWAVGAVTETLQEVGMVPIEKSLNNLIFDEKEPIFPMPEVIQAGMAGLSMALILGGLGSSSSAIRSFTESKVEKMMKLELTRREGVYDIAEKIVDETVEGPMVTVEEKKEYLPEEPKAKVSPQEKFVEKNVHKVIPKFPKKEWAVTDQESLWKLGDAIAKEVDIDTENIYWRLGESQSGISAVHTKKGHLHKIRVRLPKNYDVVRYREAKEGILGEQKRGPTHGTLLKVILHELGHIASPPIRRAGKRRIVHAPEFHKWTQDNKGKLWIETLADTGINKKLDIIEIAKARACEKYGLDSKDFKYIELPKGKVEGGALEEEFQKVIKDLQDAGYGKKEELSAEELIKEHKKKKGKVDESKVNLHIMGKDEHVKNSMKNKELDDGEQEVAESIEETINTQTPPQATPIGTKVAGWFQQYMKSLRSSMEFNPTAKNISDAILEWDGLRNEDAYLSEQIIDTFETMVPAIEDRELITRWRDMPEKYQVEITERGLQEEALWFAKQLDRMGDAAISAGVMDTFLDFYSPHMYKNLSEWLQSDRGKSAGTPLGGLLGTKFRHSLKRKLSTFEDAEAIGLEPYYDSATLLGEYMYSLSRTVHNKNLIDTLKEMIDESGNRVAVRMNNREAWAKDYRMVTHPAFAGYTVVKMKGQKVLTKVPLRWKPEVAKAIEEIGIPPWMQTGYAKKLRKLKGIVKRIIFLNPAIHGWNIFSDVLDEVNFNFVKAYRAFGKGKEIYFKDPKRTREAIRNGLAVEHIGRISQRLREEIYDLLPVEGKGVISKGVGKLFRWNDRTLWISIVRNAQMFVYDMKRTQGLTPKQAAVFTNDLLGTLPKRYFTNAEWTVGSTFFLARNWTISNLRLLTGAMGPLSNVIPGKALTRKGMSQGDLKALAPHYIKHLIKGMFGLIILTNLLNKLIAGKWAFENEPGHKMDVSLGAKDNKGRDIYIVMPLLRYMRDYIGWGTQPWQTLRNKMEPVMRTSLELLFNHSLWQNRRIMHPEASMPEKIKDAAEYALWSWTPFDQFMDSENETKTRLQKLMYFTGTWVRRGSSISSHSYNTLRKEEKVEFVRTLNSKQVNELYGQLAIGRIYGEVAQLLYKFRSKMGYKKEKLDNSIDKLLTGGDITGAIELMVESGRYKDMGAIKDRIMPYLMLRK